MSYCNMVHTYKCEFFLLIIYVQNMGMIPHAKKNKKRLKKVLTFETVGDILYTWSRGDDENGETLKPYTIKKDV